VAVAVAARAERARHVVWEGTSIIGNNLDDTFDIIWKNIANGKIPFGVSEQHFYLQKVFFQCISSLLSTLLRTGKALIVNYWHCRSVGSHYNNQPKQFPVGYATTRM
jgi:hypothetical protein